MVETIVSASVTCASTVNVNPTSPSLDRWNYPFATTPGTETTASVFAPLTATGFDPSFDNRDGQFIIGFNTSSLVTTGKSINSYAVTSASVQLTVADNLAFGYDPTPDSWRTFAIPSDPKYVADADAGRPVELFGTSFRNGFTASSWAETTAYSPLGAFGKSIRTAFPVAFNAQGQAFDVSDTFDLQIDPTAFAVGTAPLTQGQPVPNATVFTFAINTADPNIQRYLRRSLRAGKSLFTVASFFPSEQQQSNGTFPRFYTRENALVQVGAVSAARLSMNVQVSDTPVAAGDVNGDGHVNIDDLTQIILQWGPCSFCPADVNADNVVNIDDLTQVILDWSN
ncbi:MAG TPA: dockerin type I repeat-containing protein [Phycisphaerales bacterium]|nr:dockerin type I repeat-containing protein [Phycisphaerales bacterium]